MAAQGVRFTDGYTCGPNCQPTLAALMSGQYGPRTGSLHRRQYRPVPLAEPPVAAGGQRREAAAVEGHAGPVAQVSRLCHRPVRQVAPRPARTSITRRAAGFDEAIVSMGQHFDFVTSPEIDYPPGHVPRRLPHRQGRRLHHPAQGRTLLPLSASLRRPRAARSQAGADREGSRTSAPSAATTIRSMRP